MKFCGGCQAHHPLTEFSKNASKKGGLASTCKACVERYWQRYAASLPDKLLRRNPMPVFNRGWKVAA
jgi:hypothetical protein